MAHSGKNKARNQVRGNQRGVDDAAWFVGNLKKHRVKNKIAKASRRANRGK